MYLKRDNKEWQYLVYAKQTRAARWQAAWLCMPVVMARCGSPCGDVKISWGDLYNHHGGEMIIGTSYSDGDKVFDALPQS